jgi:aspartyl-tRNA(Asn)/glutamyl-tRNA(Gln) amidotransferase subunit C
MSLTLNDVKRIANLAQLEMDEAHSANMLEKLNGIFALAEQMQAVDTEGVAPLSHPLANAMQVALRLREDVATERIAARNTRKWRRRPKMACTWCRK